MRLFVTGPTGSGKSTLAAKLAQRTAVPLFPLDEIHWIRCLSGDRRRDPAERLSMLGEIVQLDAWVIEGVQFRWTDIAMERANRIVILDPPRWRTMARILRRFVNRRRFSGAGHRGTVKALLEELRWSADYYGHERRMLFDTIGQWSDKIIVVRDDKGERALIEAVSETA